MTDIVSTAPIQIAGSRRRYFDPGYWILNLLTVAFAAIWFFPVYWALATSFKTDDEAVRAGDQPYGAVVLRSSQIVGEAPSRVISASPRVISAARALSPSPSDSAMPVAMERWLATPVMSARLPCRKPMDLPLSGAMTVSTVEQRL